MTKLSPKTKEAIRELIREEMKIKLEYRPTIGTIMVRLLMKDKDISNDAIQIG